MKKRGLAFDNIPAVHIPFRFFNTAPWMGVLAAVFLMAGSGSGPGVLSPWNPSVLAVTHLLTLGFMATIMVGALFQLLPVLTGFQMPATPLVATVLHLSLLVGVPIMAAGFAFKKYELFWYAVPILLSGFLFFIISFGTLWARNRGSGNSVVAIRLAAFSLLVTILFGVFRAASYLGYPVLQELPGQAVVHFSWGLGGWVFLLVMGVSNQVIPMFHVTPDYHDNFSRFLPGFIFFVLLFLTFVRQPFFYGLLTVMLFAGMNAYAIYTLLLLTKRKRKVRDITVYFWRFAMVSVILSTIFLLGHYFSKWSGIGFSGGDALLILSGVAFIYGFACSVIMGMLQKIIPFLLYLHLQTLCRGDFRKLAILPNMHQIVSVSHSLWQLRLHLVAFGLLVCSVLEWMPILGYLSAMAMLMDFSWLGFTIARSTRVYSVTAKKLDHVES